MFTTTPPPSRIASYCCGQLQAHVSGESVRVSVCHCLTFQRLTGSIFGAQARFPRDAVSVTGMSTQSVRVGDEGSSATFRFCPQCGATVYYTMEGMSESVAIPVDAIADPLFPVLVFSVYGHRMHAWVSMPSGVERMA